MTTRFVITMTITQAAAHARLDEVHREAALRRHAAPQRQRRSSGRAGWSRLVLIGSAIAALLAAMTLAAGSASAATTTTTYTNSTPISIPSSGRATPYPSSINVLGRTGRVTNVSVTLRQFTHHFPSDVDVLLVAPDGRTSVVMSDACGGSPISGYTWTLDESAERWMPYTLAFGGCSDFLYRPTDHSEDPDPWPGAPAGPHTTDFDNFIGGTPNGAWSLYVYDDASADSGQIAGWSLTLQTADPEAVVPAAGGSGAANLYPLTHQVAGLGGVIKDVDVLMPGVYHQRPEDLELLLAGPGGQTVPLMSDACGSIFAKGLFWRFDDEATNSMLDGFYCPSGSYKPTDLAPGDPLPAPAPGGPHASQLAAFDGTDPNGAWSLYAADDQPADADGFLTDRFALDIKTRPKARTSFSAGSAEVAEGETANLTLVRDAGGDALGPAQVVVVTRPVSATTDDFDPITKVLEFGAGQSEITVPVKALADANQEGDETFEVVMAEYTGDLEPSDPSTARLRTPRSTRARRQGRSGPAPGFASRPPSPARPSSAASTSASSSPAARRAS